MVERTAVTEPSSFEKLCDIVAKLRDLVGVIILHRQQHTLGPGAGVDGSVFGFDQRMDGADVFVLAQNRVDGARELQVA